MCNFLVLQAAGGDGTVGWVLGCLGELKKQDREPVPPSGIIPLGTGNDLSRSFGWVSSYWYLSSNLLDQFFLSLLLTSFSEICGASLFRAVHFLLTGRQPRKEFLTGLPMVLSAV